MGFRSSYWPLDNSPVLSRSFILFYQREGFGEMEGRNGLSQADRQVVKCHLPICRGPMRLAVVEMGRAPHIWCDAMKFLPTSLMKALPWLWALLLVLQTEQVPEWPTDRKNCGSHRADDHLTMYNIQVSLNNNNRGNFKRMRAKAKTMRRQLEKSIIDSCFHLSHITVYTEYVFNLREEIYTCLCTHKCTPTEDDRIFQKALT